MTLDAALRSSDQAMKQKTILLAQHPHLSRSQIDRYGDLLRRYWAHEIQIGDDVIDAFRVMLAWRETFQAPLSKTATGLRSMVCSEWPDKKTPGVSIPVVQRLKRSEQIMFKLHRLSNSKLTNMGDIGGCRAVLQDRPMVDRVARRIRKNWEIVGRVRDTRDEPADSGYRGLHFIVRRDGRRIEIQLRDPREQEWAVAVERTGGRLDIPLKEGHGPADLMEYFKMASLGMYRDSVGIPNDPSFEREFADLRERVRPYFER